MATIEGPPPAPQLGDWSAPTKHSKIAPAIGVGLLFVALLGATAFSGRPQIVPTGAPAFLPGDGYRDRFAATGGTPPGSDIRFAEWSRPSPGALAQSTLIGLPFWMAKTDVDAARTSYAMLHMLQAGADGATDGLTDRLWTIGPDGARAAIEVDIGAGFSASFMVPGRLDLPASLATGDTWTSAGTINTWDDDAGNFVASPYKASFQASAPGDAALAQRGCIDVAMSQQVGGATTAEQRTWCPGTGIEQLTDVSGTWQPTTAGPALDIDPEAPFDWASADSLSFTLQKVNQPTNGSPYLTPISPPGLLEGDAVFVDKFPPAAYGVYLTNGDPSSAWAASPGGTPTASATLGGLTIVATTNRQVVAYNGGGRWVWQASIGDLSVTPAVRFGDNAIVVTLDGAVTAFDLRTGAVAWSTSLGAEIRHQPVVANNLLLVANQAGALACLDATGEMVWVVDVGVPLSMAVGGGADPVIAYATEDSVVVRGYSLADGHQVWRSRVYHTARDMMALDSTLVLRDDDVTLGLDWQTGVIKWRWAGERTAAGLGGGQRALLLGADDLVLLDQHGTPVRTWPHDLLAVTDQSPFLVAAGKYVLAFAGSRIELGVTP